jgi:Helix-turn-helix domain
MSTATSPSRNGGKRQRRPAQPAPPPPAPTCPLCGAAPTRREPEGDRPGSWQRPHALGAPPCDGREPLSRPLDKFGAFGAAHGTELSKEANAVWKSLVMAADRTTGACFPATEWLSKDTRWSPRSVKAALEELNRLGWLSWKRRGRGRSSRYTLYGPRRRP